MVFHVRPLVASGKPATRPSRCDGARSRLFKLFSSIESCTTRALTGWPTFCWTIVAAFSAAKGFLSRRSICLSPTLVCRLVEGAAERGAVPFVSWKSNAVLRSLYQTASEESMKLAGQFDLTRMERDAGLHRHSRGSQQQPVRRRAAREDGPLSAALVENGATDVPRAEDEVGRAALSRPIRSPRRPT